MQVAVAVLSEKDTGAKKLVPVGLAVYPTPAPEAVAATEEGAKWIAKPVEKESNLIAMRALRKAGGDYVNDVESMTPTIADYITTPRQAAHVRSRGVEGERGAVRLVQGGGLSIEKNIKTKQSKS